MKLFVMEFSPTPSYLLPLQLSNHRLLALQGITYAQAPAGKLLIGKKGTFFTFFSGFVVCVDGNLICYFYFSTYMWHCVLHNYHSI